MRDHFLFRKENQLKKGDKSIKKSWDKKISNLCSFINRSADYYTTSSCSGRVLILIDDEIKKDDLFLFCSHDTVSFEYLKSEMERIKSKTNRMIYFRLDPCILHIACRNLEKAQKIHDLAKDAGWKRCGIIGTKKRFVVELNATQKLEMPIINKSKILINDSFLEILVEESNKKLNDSWELIKRLEKAVTNI
ncbi:hypothetical protein AUJ63_00905 [Candidatus Pacearchaeota archaeon CG1_02_35_32]|nr:MAG: hypothetical protein AUJ63_00905 [Candidatus Pacearchaeota archaeon CG1_02_35_32]